MGAVDVSGWEYGTATFHFTQLSMDKIHFIPTFSVLPAKMSNFKNKILCKCCASWHMCIQVHKTNSLLL